MSEGARNRPAALSISIAESLAEDVLLTALRDRLAMSSEKVRLLGRAVAIRDVSVGFRTGVVRVRVDTRLYKALALFQRESLEIAVADLRVIDGARVECRVVEPLGLGFLPKRIARWKAPDEYAGLLASLQDAGSRVTVDLPDLAPLIEDPLARKMALRYGIDRVESVDGYLRVHVADQRK